MRIAAVVEFVVKPNQRERFLRLLTDVLDAMQKEATFRNATLHVAPSDPNRFLLHETWADYQDVVEVQMARSYRTEWHEALSELLEQPRTITVWSPLRRDVANGTM